MAILVYFCLGGSMLFYIHAYSKYVYSCICKIGIQLDTYLVKCLQSFQQLFPFYSHFNFRICVFNLYLQVHYVFFLIGQTDGNLDIPRCTCRNNCEIISNNRGWYCKFFLGLTFRSFPCHPSIHCPNCEALNIKFEIFTFFTLQKRSE